MTTFIVVFFKGIGVWIAHMHVLGRGVHVGYVVILSQYEDLVASCLDQSLGYSSNLLRL